MFTRLRIINMKRMKGIMTLISLALAVRLFLGFLISRTTLAHVSNDENEFRSLFEHRIEMPSLPEQLSREYCNKPGQKIDGMEGKHPDPNMKLLGTVLLIRHGDRLPISRPPAFDGYPPPERKPCSLDPSVPPTNQMLPDFIDAINHQSTELKKSMNPYLRNFDLLPDTCSDVSITQSGIVQMLELGDFLRKRYVNQNKVPGSHQDVLISTSRFARTFQSLLSFLYGFSPNRFHEFVTEKISTSSSIYFCDSDLPSAPSYTTHCNCARSKTIAQLRATFRYWDPHNPYITYIRDILKIDEKSSLKKRSSESEKKIGPTPLSFASPSRIWDWLVSEYYCPGRQLPCIPTETGLFKCLNSTVIKELIHLVDKNHLRMINDYQYIKATSLAMYPFLNSINNKFHDLVKKHKYHCASDHTSATDKQPFIWILSGHDITIGPLSVALKIPLLKKAPYASRIAFELWVSCDKSDVNCCDSNEIKPYVRILFNGKDVTSNIGHCGARTDSQSWKFSYSEKTQSSLCPLSYFNDFINIDFFKRFNSTNYEDACYS